MLLISMRIQYPFFFFLLLVTSHDRLVSNSTGGTWLEFWKISKS